MDPVLLLDFDGVLNAILPRRQVPNPDWGDWERNTVDGFTTWTSRSMAAAATALAETHWLTTWNEDNKANDLLSPLLRVGPFPVAGAPPVERDPLWKPQAVQAALNTGKPVLWFDDEASTLWDAWCPFVPDRLFFIAPDDSIGLTLAQIDEARDWLCKQS